MSFTIAIIGRPNVGKSTLFNRLVGQKLALVDDMPGVTRDRREGEAKLGDLQFTIIDTAGLDEGPKGSLTARMQEQTETAIALADALFFVIDARAGLTPADRTFADFARRADKPVLLLANKSEGKHGELGAMESYALGLGDPIQISAEHGEGMGELYDALRGLVPETEDEVDEHEETDEERAARPIRVAIVGRPNAGKSTLINHLLGEERLLTSPEAGTTRDSIAVEIEYKGRGFRIFDTAGLRRRSRIEEKLEKLSVADALRAVRFAEVVVLMMDAQNRFEEQDLRIADLIEREGRALVIAVNKWDLMESKPGQISALRHDVDHWLPQVSGVPIVAVSGLMGEGIDRLMQAIVESYAVWNRRVPTAALNRWFEEAIANNPPPAVSGRRLKLNYITQTKARPPSFVLFCSRADAIPQSYLRYLINSMRETFELPGTPVRITLREKANPFAHKRKRPSQTDGRVRLCALLAASAGLRDRAHIPLHRHRANPRRSRHEARRGLEVGGALPFVASVQVHRSEPSYEGDRRGGGRSARDIAGWRDAMADADDVLDLVGDIYDAALDPLRWPEVVGRAGQFVGGQVASIFSKSPIAGGGDVLCQSGIDPHYCQLYFDKYVKLDPATTGQYFAEIGQPIAVSDLMPQDELRQTRFYREWAAPQGMVDFISAVIDKSATTAALFGVFRYESDGLADNAARMRMQQIAPHIRRAVMIGRLIDLKSAQASAFAEALERMTCGIGLVDRLGRLVHANAAGQQLLDAGDPLFVRDGRLAARDGRTDHMLQDLIVRSGGGDAALGTGGTAMLMTSQNGLHHVAHVLPLTSRDRQAVGRAYAASAAIFMRRTMIEPPQSPELIATAYRLTPTELRVLLGIVEIGGVPEVACLLGVAETTIKTHLRRVFLKTGAVRQADLVRPVAGFMSPLAS